LPLVVAKAIVKGLPGLFKGNHPVLLFPARFDSNCFGSYLFYVKNATFNEGHQGVVEFIQSAPSVLGQNHIPTLVVTTLFVVIVGPVFVRKISIKFIALQISN
jgi:hypothetical protein